MSKQISRSDQSRNDNPDPIINPLRQWIRGSDLSKDGNVPGLNPTFNKPVPME